MPHPTAGRTVFEDWGAFVLCQPSTIKWFQDVVAFQEMFNDLRITINKSYVAVAPKSKYILRPWIIRMPHVRSLRAVDSQRDACFPLHFNLF